jgi:hypothetical protein
VEVFITATGGTITTCGDYKIHTFTSDGTFCVSAGAGPLAVVDYLVVAGGGGGGLMLVEEVEQEDLESHWCYFQAVIHSPLASPTSLPVSVQAYPITVGGGGAGMFPGYSNQG